MPAPLIARDEVVARVFDVFRTYGYEGATLARLSDATGLGRASLYHYFPGGKDDMAREAIGVARAWLAAHVIAPLEASGTPNARIEAMMRNLRGGYADGAASCVLNLFGIGEAADTFATELAGTIELWLAGLARALEGGGVRPARARRLAVDMLVRIEGSLVVARALRDPAVFVRTLEDLESEFAAAFARGRSSSSAVDGGPRRGSAPGP